MSLARESLPVASLLEPYDMNDAEETHLESGGHAPIAGAGVISGGGESHRSSGGSSWDFAVVMVAVCGQHRQSGIQSQLVTRENDNR